MDVSSGGSPEGRQSAAPPSRRVVGDGLIRSWSCPPTESAALSGCAGSPSTGAPRALHPRLLESSVVVGRCSETNGASPNQEATVGALWRRCDSLTAQLKEARDTAVRHEMAMGSKLKQQRLTGDAQALKIRELTDERDALMAERDTLARALNDARAAAVDSDAIRENLAREAEAFEASVSAAVAAKEKEWEAREADMARREAACAEPLARNAALERQAAELWDDVRRIHAVHAADKLLWATERAELVARHRHGLSYNSHPADDVAATAAVRATLSGEGTSTGAAAHDSFIATRRGSRGAVEGLLTDAMEDEVAEAMARGYSIDAADGSVQVGAGEIIAHIVAKYTSSPENESTKPHSRAAILGVGRGGAQTPVTNGAETHAGSSDEVGWRRERTVLLAHVQEVKARAASAIAGAATTIAGSLASGAVPLLPSECSSEMRALRERYDREEEAVKMGLAFAVERRVLALEAALERERVKRRALTEVREGLTELKAQQRQLRAAAELASRLVQPTVSSALACLRMDADAGASAKRGATDALPRAVTLGSTVDGHGAANGGVGDQIRYRDVLIGEAEADAAKRALATAARKALDSLLKNAPRVAGSDWGDDFDVSSFNCGA